MTGRVVSVRGSVADVRFDEHLPPIYSVLRGGTENEIVIEGAGAGYGPGTWVRT